MIYGTRLASSSRCLSPGRRLDSPEETRVLSQRVLHRACCCCAGLGYLVIHCDCCGRTCTALRCGSPSDRLAFASAAWLRSKGWVGEDVRWGYVEVPPARSLLPGSRQARGGCRASLGHGPILRPGWFAGGGPCGEGVPGVRSYPGRGEIPTPVCQGEKRPLDARKASCLCVVLGQRNKCQKPGALRGEGDVWLPSAVVPGADLV